MAIGLYPKVKVKGLDFKGTKRVVVPNQCLSLDEIVRRFVRREPLQVTSKEAFYEERFGDLEKIAKGDLVEQEEAINDLKAKIAAFEKRRLEKEKENAPKAVPPSPGSASAPKPVLPSPGSAPAPVEGEPPLKSPAPQGP